MATVEQTYIDGAPLDRRTVSWGAIFCGAVVAASLYLIFSVLGAGLGFSALSPWSYRNYAPGLIGATAIAWIIVTQIISSAGGGYIAGRLAPKEEGISEHEIHFRDAAHGLAVWAVATLVIAAFFALVAGTLLSSGAAVLEAAGKGAEMTFQSANASREGEGNAGLDRGASNPVGYAIDSLFRSAPGVNGVQGNAPADTGRGMADVGLKKEEVARIFANSIWENRMSDADTQYVAGIVSQYTGLSASDATKRVTDAFNQTQATVGRLELSAKQTIDRARKATAMASLWTFVALLCGAVISAVAGNFGGAWHARLARRLSLAR